ncbi:MAG: phosphatase PAP2 family protein [Ilumatobacteraceae bacterium]|nr:phosphatase PAP2 family protein [Ilumatobacteraceae bacterium]
METATESQDGGTRRPLATWWRSRYGAQMLVEISIVAGLLMIYRSIRTLNRTDLQTAFSNSRDIIRFESWLGLPFEDNLQGFLLDHPNFIKMLNHYYIWFHFPAAIALLLWLYLRHSEAYRSFRNLMAFSTFTGLIIHLLFPLAPPRMMDGFVDTMARYGPAIYPANPLEGAANQIAAMPSLHFAWAMIEAIAVVSVLTSRWRWVVVIHPVLMTLAIIATANHWWIDAAAAAFLVVTGIALWRVLTAWVGDRRWSWTSMRFQAGDGIKKLEDLANEPRPESADC